MNRNHVLWIVQGVLALIFLFASAMKLITPIEVLAVMSPLVAGRLGRGAGRCSHQGSSRLTRPFSLLIATTPPRTMLGDVVPWKRVSRPARSRRPHTSWRIQPRTLKHWCRVSARPSESGIPYDVGVATGPAAPATVLKTSGRGSGLVKPA